MKFNADVLDVILKCLDARSDVSAMMRSFRTAYAFGAKYLLKQHIEITNSEELLSFCYFMHADLVSRAPHLRQLHLQVPFAYESTLSKRGLFTDATNEGVCLLVTILRRATRLQHLSIDFCEGLLRRDERLVSVVSDCTSLYSLQVSSIDTSAHRLLASLQSSLNVLDVDFGNECLLPFSRFLDIIARQPALERLTAWYLDLTSTDGAQAIQRCSKRRSFPSIHTLSLRSFDGLDLSSLHAAFPNIRDLTFAGYAVPNPAHTLDDLRKANAAYSLKRVWGSKEYGLDVLAGDAAALYALGAPACRARTLIVSHALDAAASVAALQVSTIICDAHPFRLVLHLGYGPEDTNVATWAEWNWATEVCDIFGFLRALAAHLGAEPAGRLTHLAFDFCTSTIGGPIGAPELKLLLTGVRVFLVRMDGGDRPLNGAPPIDRDLRGSLDQFLEETGGEDGAQSTADSLFGGMPSLEVLSMEIRGVGSSFWRRRARNAAVEKMDPEEGRVFLRKEAFEFRCIPQEPPRYQAEIFPEVDSDSEDDV